MNYIEIKMEVKDRDAVEALSNMLAEMGTGGVMIEDPQAISDYANSGLWDAHEFSEELMSRKDVIIKSYLKTLRIDSGHLLIVKFPKHQK